MTIKRVFIDEITGKEVSPPSREEFKALLKEVRERTSLRTLSADMQTHLGRSFSRQTISNWEFLSCPDLSTMIEVYNFLQTQRARS